MRSTIVILLAVLSVKAVAQFAVPPAAEPMSGCSRRTVLHSLQRTAGSFADPNIDVSYYRLNLTIDPLAPLVGSVTVSARIVPDSLGTCMLDLSSALTLDSVTIAGQPAPTLRFADGLSLTFDRLYGKGEMVTFRVYYHGVPAGSGFGSFVYASRAGSPWIWSLSEPYGARDWWPCKDHPMDKADSVDVVVTAPSEFLVASNGRLISRSVDTHGRAITFWSERYPIATYLVSVALTTYTTFTDWWHYSPVDSMQVLNYVTPENLPVTRPLFAKVPSMLDIYSRAYGEYPFVKEKYGHAEFGAATAMEHQTMTSTGTLTETTTAHELAHQWFGDLITCANWSSLWLNEGFATYSEAVYAGAAYGESAYWTSILSEMNDAIRSPGTLYVQDTSSVRDLFLSTRVYSKGATVLHMLRHVVGDSLFFRGLRAYVADPLLRYGTATTEDLERNFESVAGRNLRWFFHEWVFGENFPKYTLRWQPAIGSVDLTISQVTNTTNPPVFVMPIDLTISTTAGDTLVTVFNDRNDQTFSIPLSGTATNVQIDKNNWILKEVVDAGPPLPATFVLQQNFPNPFNPSTSIRFGVPHRSTITLGIYSILGAEVRVLVSGKSEAGSYTAAWDGKDGRGQRVASGMYLCRLVTDSGTITRKLVLAR